MSMLGHSRNSTIRIPYSRGVSDELAGGYVTFVAMYTALRWILSQDGEHAEQ